MGVIDIAVRGKGMVGSKIDADSARAFVGAVIAKTTTGGPRLRPSSIAVHRDFKERMGAALLTCSVLN